DRRGLAVGLAQSGMLSCFFQGSRQVFCLKVAEKSSRSETVAGCLLDDFLSRETLAHAMDIGAQPCEQAAKFAAADFVIKGMLARVTFRELRRIKATQCIGRKISEHTERPMHILKHAFAVGFRRCPDQGRAA